MRLIVGLLCGLVTLSQARADTCDWPEWQSFKQHYISREGRVIDPSDGKEITTSEGQSYGLFFALVANDRDKFNQLLEWTENNLAAGDMSARLPGWQWGKRSDNSWGVLDTNSASDADLWIAYTLLEAGRIWHSRGYQLKGTLLLQRIARDEVVDIPGLGHMLLPGKTGFTEPDGWRLNPSYQPPQLLSRLSQVQSVWADVAKSNHKLLLQVSPAGLAPDWVIWHQDKGWQADAKNGAKGDYDAIRVYLWIGMMADGAPEKAELIAHYQPMMALTERAGLPPERVDSQTGASTGNGPVGFSAALLPFLTGSPALAIQRERVVTNLPGSDAYYNSVLTLFGLGWDRQYYRFNQQGELQASWEKDSCKNIK
ncbi:cellulose synthase complex periplasmic endoglucanase BcsZ [Budvicia diplopodorum]|uniref:cellulose synthase complex periplasmic endoglucanase BcsZ n=1 Tax=Budvicia diplopodorum TaxID=1119056 RepID=UPI001FE7FB0E|nr:cellulose synthase complex periplasmic endoglucanase BcsZ [Budvicia diplopodorum]